MFCPTQLVVSVQGTFVLIDTVDGRNPKGVQNVPKHLLADVRFGKSPVRTYEYVIIYVTLRLVVVLRTTAFFACMCVFVVAF